MHPISIVTNLQHIILWFCRVDGHPRTSPTNHGRSGQGRKQPAAKDDQGERPILNYACCKKAIWDIPNLHAGASQPQRQLSPEMDLAAVCIPAGTTEMTRREQRTSQSINFCLPPEGQEEVNLLVVLVVLLGIISFFFHWPCLQTSFKVLLTTEDIFVKTLFFC